MLPIDDNMIAWMNEHKGKDCTALRLKYAHQPMAIDAITQMECRRKASAKLPITLKNSYFTFPTTLSAEQCTSDALAQFHTSLIKPGSNVLDLTCGLGIDSFHIASVAAHVTTIEINTDIAEIAAHNAKLLNVNNISITNQDSTHYIATLPDNSFDTIFIDPARRANGHKVVSFADCSPNIIELQQEMFRVAPLLIVKASPMLDISMIKTQLTEISDIYTVGSESECKEIVILCKRGFHGIPSLHAVSVPSGNAPHLTITANNSSHVIYGQDPTEGEYLYEPWPAIMKAALHSTLCNMFEVTKLAPDTHLYTSKHLIDNFPGKKLRIKHVIHYDKRGIKEVKASYPIINVSTRSFPLTPPQLVKTLGIKEGGETMLYGVTLPGKRRYYMLVCENA